MKTKTGDIVVPPEGFKFQNPVTTKSPELAKFQTLLKANLPTWNGGKPLKVQVVKDFMKAIPDGGYGTRTQALVFWLKDGLSAPKYADSDKNTILPDFVNRMLKEFNLIKESNSYRGIRSRGVISEDFDFEAAADSGGGSTVVTPKVVTPKKDKDGNPIVVAKKDGTSSSGKSGEYTVTGYPTLVFKNVGGQAFTKSVPPATTFKDWVLVTDTTYIKNIVNSPENGAIKAQKDRAWYFLSKYPTYRFSKMKAAPSGWSISKDKGVSFTELTMTDLTKEYIDALNRLFGGSSISVSGTAMPIATIRKNHKTFGTFLASFWASGSSVLKDFHGTFATGWDDNEGDAWDFIKRQVNANKDKGMPLLDLTLKGIKLLPEGPEKEESLANDKYLRKQLTSAEGKCGLFGKHMGQCWNDDVYKLRLEQGGAQTLSIDINTDF